MSVVYLTSPGASVRRRGERLEVFEGDAKVADVRLFDLERVVVLGPVQFSTQALALLLDRGVDVSFLTTHGRLRGSLVSGQSRNVFLRLAQYERWRDPAFRLALSREIVVAKITAQLRVLLRYERNHPGSFEPAAVHSLREMAGKVGGADSVDSLRGLEGAGAAVYYGQFGKMLTTVGFPGRKKHPSTDPANALLSLGYVLLGNEIAAMLEARGFDPAIGFLHGLRYGRQSLALDLIEAFRQPVVDRLTLRLLNRRQIGADDFEGGERGLLLKPGPFKTYLGLYEEHLRGASEGAGSPTWREQVVRQVDSFREMVMAGEISPVYSWTDAKKPEDGSELPTANLEEGEKGGEISGGRSERGSD